MSRRVNQIVITGDGKQVSTDKVIRHNLNVGPRGPAGTDGERGPKGDTGAGLNVLGSLGDYADLPTTGLNPGDGYIIDGVVWAWDGSAWVEVAWSGPELPRRLHEEAQVAGSDWVDETGWTSEGTEVPSTFTRASQAWDGTGLVPPDTMRVFGRDTKSPVVLIEGQRTNLLNGSADFSADTSSWTGTGDFAITPVPGLAEGEVGWLHENLSAVQNRARVYTTGVWTGSPETLTVTLGRGTSQSTTVSFFNNTAPSHILRANLNWDTGEAGLSTGTGEVQATWLDEDTVVLRVTGTGPSGAIRRFILYPTLYDAVATGQTLTIYRAQLEEAPFASSYIPTAGSPATRAAEVQYISGLSIPKRGVTVSIAWHALHIRSTLQEAFYLQDESSGDFVALRTSSNGEIERVETSVGGIVLASGTVISGWAAHTVVIEDDGRITRYANGELIGTTAPVEWLEGNWSRLFLARSQPAFNVWRPIAPGAAALGVPFIDNRAWSAEEIQAAHARWLPELQKIEVPV